MKVESAAESAIAINPHVKVEAHPFRLDASNAVSLISRYDVVLDGSDNFSTRFLVNDACFFAERTLVSAAVGQFDGQLAVYKAHQRVNGKRAFPCYRCLFPEAPPPGTVPSCTEAGILGALTGVMGSMQALETLKELLGIGDTLAGRLMLYDALGGLVRSVQVPPEPDCALCGPHPRILSLTEDAPSSCSAT